MSNIKHRSRRRRSGLTLVEVLVAVAILAMIAVLLWGGFSQTARNKAYTEQQVDRHHVARSALERMSRELAAAYVSIHLNPNEALQTVRTAFVGVDRSNGDRVDFTSFSHQRLYRDAHESDQNELSYFVTRSNEDPDQRVLARREQSRIDDDPRRGGRSEVLVENIRDFELEYLDPISGDWVRSWDTTQTAGQPNRLPSQVKIILTLPDLRDATEDVVFGTRAVIPTVWALNFARYN